MKLIKYVLTSKGETPAYIDTNQPLVGYAPVYNYMDSPKDYYLIGIGEMDESMLPPFTEVFHTYDELLEWLTPHFDDAVDKANSIWAEYEQAIEES